MFILGFITGSIISVGLLFTICAFMIDKGE